MSAFNVFIGDDDAFLFSDTCLYTPDGTAQSFASKAYPLATHRAAFGGRGGHALKLAVLSVIEATTPADESFDALSDRLESVFDQALAMMTPHIQGDWSTSIELFFAGWSERDQKMKCFIVYNREIGGVFSRGKLDPGRGGFIQCPKIDGTDFAIDMHRFGDTTINDIPGIGVFIMDRQQQMVQRDFPDSHIDGQVILTHVTRDGVSMRPLYRWEPGAAPVFPV